MLLIFPQSYEFYFYYTLSSIYFALCFKQETHDYLMCTMFLILYVF